VVTLDHQGNYFINSKKVDSTFFDSSLVRELRKLNSVLRRDSAIIVINADSSVNFGKIYHVMQIAKRSRARVVFNMKLD
jgi:biopolymer transport protein ExbD